MRTLEKKSLFWDVGKFDPRKREKFVLGRILSFGHQDDFKWALNFYGKEKIKKYLLNAGKLDKKSESFWRRYFNLSPPPCPRKPSIKKQSAFWRK